MGLMPTVVQTSVRLRRRAVRKERSLAPVGMSPGGVVAWKTSRAM